MFCPLVFIAVDFLCTDPSIKAISFVGSDHVVRINYLLILLNNAIILFLLVLTKNANHTANKEI